MFFADSFKRGIDLRMKKFLLIFLFIGFSNLAFGKGRMDFGVCTKTTENSRCVTFERVCRNGVKYFVNGVQSKCRTSVDSSTCKDLQQLLNSGFKEMSAQRAVASQLPCQSISIKTPNGFATHCVGDLDPADRSFFNYIKIFRFAESVCRN